MVTRVLPDTEAIAIAYLLTRSEVTNVFGQRIAPALDLTKPAERPALRVTRVGTTSPVRRHLRAGNTQLEAFAATELAAQDGLELALAVLNEDAFVGTHPGLGVVTGVAEGIGPRRQPDPVTRTPRWLASLIIYAHPIPE